MKQDLIWQYYQNEAPEFFAGSLTRLRFLVRRIAPGAEVLNIGVGTGLFESLAAERGVVVFSVDPDDAAIEALKTRTGAGERARIGYAQKIPFADASFDTVVASEVLEHLDDRELAGAVEEIHRVLRPGGRFFGTVPAREDLKSQMVVCPKCGERFHRWGHLQRFDPERIGTVLAERFVVETVREIYFIPWQVLNWKGMLAETARWLSRAAGGRSSGESLFFSAVKG